MDREDSLDGPAIILDFLRKSNPRVSKSRLHTESGASVSAVDRAGMLAGSLGEFYNVPETLRQKMVALETGKVALPMDLITDAKCLFDLIQLHGAGRTSDEGSQLNVTFVR